MAESPVLLPTQVRPYHYDVDLVPDLTNCVFSGVVTILVNALVSTNQIVLNAKELAFQRVEFTDASGKKFFTSQISQDEKEQTVKFEFVENFTTGNGSLRIEYTGVLNNDMVGFYASKYEKNGVKKNMATTQFEAVYARRAIPCWDEPAIKAAFTVHLTVQKDLTAVSNMPVVSTSQVGDKVKYTYDKSPIMSTYLLAFVIGEFEYVEAVTKGGVKIRVYTPVGKTDQGNFGLDIAVKCLDFYDKYFEIPYPLPKLDMLAIPDFAMGAMENWGCVTYRSTALLVDPKMTSASVKQWVALVIAHELAHQWFGNLVTMEWWTHLWLNEGFASWVEYLAIDHIFPEWQVWTQFVYQDMRRALELDSLKNSHPVEVPVSRAEDVDEIFDSISYSKGASIIRMLVCYLGEEEFRKGMVVYLNRHKYANASTEDLWKALGDYSKKDVKGFMDRWTKTMGYPVLALSDSVDGHKVSISQCWFLADGSTSGADDTGAWQIPLKVVSHGGISTMHLVKSREDSFELPVGDWFKLNASQEGLYRVQYTPKMISNLKNALIESKIQEPLDRLGLQLDALSLSKCGRMNTADVLTLFQGYKAETNYTVWADLSANVSSLVSVFAQTDLADKLNIFVKSLYSNIFEKLGWDGKDGEDHLTHMLRSLVIPKLGRAGHDGIISESCKRFSAFAASGFKDGLIPDLRAGVYSIVLKNGGRYAFEMLLNLYRTAEFQEEKVRALAVLATTPDENLFLKVLEMSLSDEVRKQDVIYIFRNLHGGKNHLQLAWTFVKSNWKKIVELFGETMLSSIIKSFGDFASLEKASELEAFFNENAPAKLKRTVQQSLESVRINAAWLNRDYSSVKEWLDKNI